jgi:putative ABC transport system substrate-binding protein
MKRKVLALCLCALLFALSLRVEAQQQLRVPTIGWLGAFPAASDTGREVFGRELGDLGYIEGKNIAFEYRYADNRLDRLPALADELVRLKVDALLTPAVSAALAAKNATRTIPIVFLNVSDPVRLGLIESIARPGNNITGMTDPGPELIGKRLEVLKEAIPKLSRVAVLWNPQDPVSARQWKESQLPARSLGLQLDSLEVSSSDRYEGAFKEAIKVGSAALAVAGSSLARSNQKRIADLATQNRLPVISSRRDYVANGGLMSYGADQSEPYRRVASMVDKILKGAKPGNLPVEQPTKFEFIINLNAAKQIGLTIPPNVLARADRVIR